MSKGRKKRSLISKINTIIIVYAVFVITTYTAFSYQSSKAQIIEAAGIELTGCASITSGTITDEMIAGIVKGDKKQIEKAKEALGWITESKPIFLSASIINEDGKIIVQDHQLEKDGVEVGDVLLKDKEVFSHATSGHHSSAYTDFYEINDTSRMAGIAPIENELGEKLYMTIEFDKNVISERIWDNLIASVKFAWILPVVALFVTRKLIKKYIQPLETVTKEIEQIKNGDLSFDVTVFETKDEIEELSTSIKEMKQNIKVIIEQVQNTSDDLKQTSALLVAETKETSEKNKEISDDIQIAVKGANDQLYQTRESAAAMDEISSQVLQIAKNSEVMKKSTENTSDSIQRMAKSIEEVTEGTKTAATQAGTVQEEAIVGKNNVDKSKQEMEVISGIIDEASRVMSHLGESSQEIGKIIEVIDSIAEQTNLLALNAAIEAARAGEHGKGFSVVADEVKNLAERSANATKEIAQLIEGIQEETRTAVKAIEVGSEKVQEGNKLAGEASKSIEGIVEGIRNITKELSKISEKTIEQGKQSALVVDAVSTLEEQVNQVAKATQEQTIGVNEITNSIGKIAEITETTTKQLGNATETGEKANQAVENIAKTSKNIDTATQELLKQINRFKIEE